MKKIKEFCDSNDLDFKNLEEAWNTATAEDNK